MGFFRYLTLLRYSYYSLREIANRKSYAVCYPLDYPLQYAF